MTQAILIGLIAFAAYMADALGYSQYDRPLCTGLLVGLALGDVEQGLTIGASLELLYMGTITIGGAFPPDIYTGGVLGAAFAISTGSGIEGAMALSLPIGTLALVVKQIFYSVVRGYFVHRADRLAAAGDDHGVAMSHIWGTLAYNVPMAVLVGACFYVGGPAVQAVVDMIPEWVMNGLSAASGMIPALGFAMLVKLIVSKELAPYFFIGFLVAGYLEIPVLGVACFALAVAALVIFNDSRKAASQLAVVAEEDDNDF